MSDNPLDPSGDPFGPPKTNVEVQCLHCGEQYDSYRIEWRVKTDADGKQHGFWCCPTPGCGGMGFGFDILPTDPHYRDERGGWVYDDEDDEEYDEDEFGEEDFDDDALPEGPTDLAKPGNNGHGRPKPTDVGEDDVPF
jgi:hypothetical protein